MSSAMIQAVGGCQCGSTAGANVQFLGCGSSTLNGYQIDVYASSGGAFLFSVTTGGTGTAYVAPGTYWFQSHDGFFNGPTATIPSSGLTPVTMAPASGYSCCNNVCVVPLPNTLYFTSQSGNTCTMTKSGSTYTGTFTVPETILATINNITCAYTTTPGTITVTVTLECDGTATMFWPIFYNFITLEFFGYGKTPPTIPAVCAGYGWRQASDVSQCGSGLGVLSGMRFTPERNRIFL